MAFKEAHEFVERWEVGATGDGLVDDPHDRGGITKWGVSLRALVAKGLDLNGDGVVNRKDIIGMTRDQSLMIFSQDYYLKAKCDLLPAGLDLVHYNCSVNQGPRRSAVILQKTCRVTADGKIGPITLGAMRRTWARGGDKMIVEYCARQCVHYSSLSQIVRYGLGWFRRLFDANRAALEIWRVAE